MRTTGKEVMSVFEMWVKAVNGHTARDYKDVGGYLVDHNSVYGGYAIEQIVNEHGGVSDNVFLNTRLSAYPFVCALRASIRSMEQLRLNTNDLVKGA